MDAVILGNFDVVAQNMIPNFTKTGFWYEYYSGDSLNVTDVAAALPFTPGEYRLYTTVRLPKPVFTGIDSPTEQPSSGCQVKVFPNPSSGPVNFELLAGKTTDAELVIYDFSGKPAGTVFVGIVQRGTHDFIWDPGRALKPGLYFYRLVTSAGSSGGKFIIL